MDTGELLLRATAWLSLIAWAVAESFAARRQPVGGAHRLERARLASTIGLIALLLHVALAFDLRYAWSHDLAARETARQTEETTGSRFGGGLLVNYAFALVWATEVAWWWRWPELFRKRPRLVTWLVRAIFLFMFVNGAFVFVRGPMRVVGVAAIVAVLWAWYVGNRSERPS